MRQLPPLISIGRLQQYGLYILELVLVHGKMMKRLQVASFSVIALTSLTTSCTIEKRWPRNMKPVTYTGKVIHEQTGAGVAGATVEFKRKRRQYAKSMLGDWAVEGQADLLTTTVTDRSGQFSATTASGYATYASALTGYGPGSLYGSIGSTSQTSGDAKRLPTELVIPVK